jgi:hypothetical protein
VITVASWMAFLPVVTLVAGMVLAWWVKRGDYSEGWQNGRFEQALHISPQDEAEYYFHDAEHCKGACGRHGPGGGLAAAGHLGTWAPRAKEPDRVSRLADPDVPTAAEVIRRDPPTDAEVTATRALRDAGFEQLAPEVLDPMNVAGLESSDYPAGPGEGSGGIRQDGHEAGGGTPPRLTSERQGTGRRDRRDWHKRRGPYAAQREDERLADEADDFLIREEDERAWWASVAADPGLRQIELVHA